MNKVSRSILYTLLTSIFFIGLPSKIFSDPYWLFFECDSNRSPGAPVRENLIQAVTESGCRIRTISRYFNAVSVDVDFSPDMLCRIDGVKYVTPVKRFARKPFHGVGKPVRVDVFAGEQGEHSLSYGVSYRQLNALNIPELHDMGLTGGGVVIGVLDAGFNIDGTGCLGDISISHTWNFITGSEDITGNQHGTHVLSCLGGALEDKYYGAAFGAEFLLAVTDDYDTETRADEDRWVAAVEWCDSLGADIISSSLVYNIFDTQEESYSKNDMDGRTSLVARAAEIAFARGIVMVNSAGNEGANSWRIITTPADAEHVIAVGSVLIPEDGEPLISDFSSRGPTTDGRIKPDVVAPGEKVYIPYAGQKEIYYTSRGTSFAAPFISGLCALLLEAHPNWTPETVFEALKVSARDLGDTGPDNDYGWGIPDGISALNYLPTGIAVDETAEKELSKDKNEHSIIKLFALLSPYPNPFNPVVAIPFRVNKEAHVAVEIFDITGSITVKLWDKSTPPGYYRIMWDGGGYASGVYFVRVSSERVGETVKILLMK